MSDKSIIPSQDNPFSIQQESDINVFYLFDILYNKKIFLLIIFAVSLVFGLLLEQYIGKKYSHTLHFKEIQAEDIKTKFSFVNVNEKLFSDYNISSEILFYKFKNEFENYNTLSDVIFKYYSDDQNNNTTDLSDENILNKALDYQLIYKPRPKNIEEPLEFYITWENQNSAESSDILFKSLEIINDKVKNSVASDFERIQNAIKIKNEIEMIELLKEIKEQRSIVSLKTKARIAYLQEQMRIASGLGIDENALRTGVNNQQNVNMMTPLNEIVNFDTIYLRGADALNEEILAMEKRLEEDNIDNFNAKYADLEARRLTIENDSSIDNVGKVKELILNSPNFESVLYRPELTKIRDVSKSKFLPVLIPIFSVLIASLIIITTNAYRNYRDQQKIN